MNGRGDPCEVGSKAWYSGKPPCGRPSFMRVQLFAWDSDEVLVAFYACPQHFDEIIEAYRPRESVYEPERLPDVVLETAKRHRIMPAALDWHVEAVHGWEPHDEGYDTAVRAAATCLLAGGCE